MIKFKDIIFLFAIVYLSVIAALFLTLMFFLLGVG